MSEDPRAEFMTTALDPAARTAPCPVCGFPTVIRRDELPTTCTRCRAQMIAVAYRAAMEARRP